MKTFKARTHIVWMVLLLFFGCDEGNRGNKELAESDSGKIAEKSAISLDTVLIQQTSTQASLSNNDSMRFEARMDSITAFFLGLGFKREADIKLIEPNQYRKHWWLKEYYRRSTLGKTPEFPGEDDPGKIKSIRQFTFKKVWKYKIEQWSFDSEDAAQRWYSIAKYARGSKGGYYLQKPPNVFWLEGSKLYIIMATTAADWFEYSDKVIENFAGMTKAEIREQMKQ